MFRFTKMFLMAWPSLMKNRKQGKYSVVVCMFRKPLSEHGNMTPINMQELSTHTVDKK